MEWQIGSGGRKTISEFADYLNIPRSVVNHYLNGRTTPKRKNTEKIATKLGPEAYHLMGFQRPDPEFKEIRRIYDKATEVEATQTSANPNDTLFQTMDNQPMDRDRLYKIISKIGNRAKIKDCHPHRFRHTFAILYLRNKGDPWSLQRMLGHATMEMVSNYLAIAQSDMDASHRSASPVENLRL